MRWRRVRLPRVSDAAVDGRMLGFCALATVLTVLVFGVLPPGRHHAGALADFLREGGRGTGAARQHRLQDGLVIVQLTVAFVLLTGAGLLVESFTHFERIDLGFRPEGVLTADITVPPQRYPTAGRGTAFAMRRSGAARGPTGRHGGKCQHALAWRGLRHLPFTVVGDPPPDPSRAPLARARIS